MTPGKYWVCIAIFAFGVACVSRPLDDNGTPDDSSTVPREDATCEQWCVTAVSCSEIYAQEWNFSTQSDCEDRCHTYYDGFSNISDGACEDPLLDLFECASDLTCEQFQDMEKDHWRTEFIQDPACDAEYAAFSTVGLCN